ncbi:MAG: hypothetical protein UDK36_05695 [Bacteroidaceae bacterium]|nr:hypothetical protein [Bacteroidaceae bacterium]
MEKEKLTVNDEELIELAYSTTYRSNNPHHDTGSGHGAMPRNPAGHNE